MLARLLSLRVIYAEHLVLDPVLVDAFVLTIACRAPFVLTIVATAWGFGHAWPVFSHGETFSAGGASSSMAFSGYMRFSEPRAGWIGFTYKAPRMSIELAEDAL